MRAPRWTLALATAAVGSALLVGCSQPAEEAVAPPAVAPPTAPAEQAATTKSDTPDTGVQTVVLNAKGMH